LAPVEPAHTAKTPFAAVDQRQDHVAALDH
jgi:hypothetical protein